MLDRRNKPARRAAAFMLAGAMIVSAAACSSPEQRMKRFAESGQEYLEKGDIGRANVQFQNALKIDEDHIPSLLGIAEIAEQKQDFSNMYGVLQKVVRLDPAQLGAQVQLGKLQLVAGETADALETADKALALSPESPDAMALKAAVLIKLDDVASAVELARKALAADPANPEAVAVVATERALAKDFDGALVEIEKALAVKKDIPVLHLLRLQILSNLNRTEELLEAHRDLISVRPEEVAYRKLYARSLIEAERREPALVELKEIARLSKGDVDDLLNVVRMEAQISGADAAGKAFKDLVDAHPSNHELKFRYAAYLRGQKDFAGAEAIYKAFVASKSDPSLAMRARNEIAGQRLIEGRVDEARRLIDEILKLDSRNTDALLKRASLKIDDGEYDSAILDLRSALEDRPDSTQAKLLMASAFERKGDLAFAKTQLAQAVAESKNDPAAANLFARLLMRTGETERAERTLSDSLAAFPYSVENLKLLAAVRLMRQDWRGAEEVAKRIEDVSTTDPSVERILGAAYTGMRDYDSAITALSAARDRGDLGDRPLATLIGAYVQGGRADEAADLLAPMIASNPDNHVARILAARVAMARNKNDEAETQLREVVRRAPDRMDAVDSLYRLLLISGRRDDAAAMLDQAIAAAPDNIAAKILKADSLLSQGKQEDAMQMYADILQRRPGDLLASNNYASLLSDLRDDPQSRARAAEIAKVLEGNDNPYFLDTLGWAQFRNGDAAAARATLEKAVGASTGLADAHLHLGVVYQELGETERARAEFRKAAEAGRNTPVGRRAEELLGANQ